MFYNDEIRLRERLEYPPFTNIVLIGISGFNQKEVQTVSNELYNTLEKNINPNINLYKPLPAPINRIKNRFRWRIIIKCKFNDDVINIINKSLSEINNMKTRIIVDVNPNNMN